MKTTRRQRLASLLCALAGACDGLTGLLLIVAPLATLRLMHITTLPTEPIYMRWIGVFVCGVGCAYGLPFCSRYPAVRQRRLVGVLEVTALIRTFVALFIAVAVLRRALEPGWLAVFATDIVLAATQLALLRSGALEPRAP